MKRSTITLVIVVLLGMSLAQVAEARWRGGHRGHGGVDIVIDPFGWAYYPPPLYYYPPQPIYVAPHPPPVYIEQPPVRTPPPQSYWYYCTNPQGYYPTIKECPGGWLKVVPQTP